MPLVADRTKETSTTTGTGTLTLQGAPTGFQTFTAAFGNGVSVYYVIAGGSEYEIGIGTTGAGTLSRDTVLQSTNADALVAFSAGVKDVFCAYVADRAVTTSDAATLTNKTIDDYTNNVGANSTHFRVKASAIIPKGAVVKAVGFTPGQQAVEVAVVASSADVAIGITEQPLTSGQFGMAVVIGELFDVNTAGYTLNDVLYSNGAGGFTATKPSSGTYQTLGTIVRANTNNGVIAVNIVSPLFVEVSTNTANTLALRDGSGNFAAGTITAALTGNASTATALQTARAINGVNFDGTAAITVTADAGTLTGATLAAGVTASSLTSVGTLGGLTVTNPITGSVTGSSGSTTGNAATATALQTARNINGVSFNGTADVTVTAAAGTLSGATLASGVTASSLTSVGTLTGLTTSGTTSLATSAGDLSVRSVAYTWPVSQGAASTVLTNNGSGALTWAAPSAGAAAAGTLTGATLASNVLASSLTSVGTLSALTVGGFLTMQGAKEKVTVSATAATGTINFDVSTQAVLFYTTNASGTWTLNLRGDAGTTLNSLLAVGQAMTVTFMVQVGNSAALYQAATSIDGVAVTPRWQGTYAPISGFSNSINIYTFTVIKTAATPTYTVLASQIAY